MTLQTTSRYDDIIDMPHHVSRRHPPMPRLDRAAQFMPFAALSGYEQIIAHKAQEVEREVQKRNRLFDCDFGA